MTVTGSSSQRPAGDLDREAKLPLIAVIAVHGVADQAPNESARQIAELLLRQRYEGDAAAYTSFREYPLRIPVDPPLPLCNATTCTVGEPDVAGTVASRSGVDLDFTHSLLHQYQSRRTPYDTVRLEGHRLREPAKAGERSDWIARDQCHVHVYELFWADLSRLGTGLRGFIGAIYQLISSLAQLGMRTIEQARREHDPRATSRPWTAYLSLHRFAVWLLTVVVPFLNLCILGAALTMLVARIPRNTQAALFALLVVLFVLGVRTYIRLRAKKAGTAASESSVAAAQPARTSKGPSIGWLVVWGAVGGVIYWGLTRHVSDVITMRLAASVWVVLQTAALILLGRVYEERIDTSFKVGLAVGLPTAALLVAFVWTSDDVVQVAHGAVRTIEVLFLVLTASWIFLTVAGISSAIAAAVVLASGAARRERARRASWTAASTLAVSTASLSALTLFAWSALYAVLAASLPAPSAETVVSMPVEVTDLSQQPIVTRLITPDTSYAYTPLATHVMLASRRSGVCFDAASSDLATTAGAAECHRFSLKSMLRTLLSVSAMAGLVVNGLALCLTAAIGLWLALPSVIQEVRPRTDPGATPDRSVALGVWLTQGFLQLRKAAVGVYGLIFGGTGIVIGLALWMWLSGERTWSPVVSFFEVLQPRSDSFIFGIGSLVAASTVGLVALLTRFESWSKMVRPALDVSLDVDNYLKSRPVVRTPRARMMERFVALLRYVTRWRRHGAGYDAIIVIAHSQGSVLTSELLRYQAARGFTNLSLKTGYPWPDAQGETKATRLSVDFFTMGSPLRQLYNSSFPDLFAWTDLPQDCGPDDSGRAFCDTLGLRRWWNVYRSGDYVGRALWQYRGEAAAYVPGEWRDKGESCREKCLGPGAHTHYWNESGSDVGEVLDEMISLAYEASPRR